MDIKERFAYITPLHEVHVPNDGGIRTIKPLVTVKTGTSEPVSFQFNFMVVITGARLSKEYHLIISVSDVTHTEEIILVNTGQLEHFETKENDLGFCTVVNQIQLSAITIKKPSLYRIDFTLFDDESLVDEIDSYHVYLNAETGE